MAELKIIRASAGSGKTYSLTEEILKTLLKKPDNYFKHLLAVTFTNKATAEMKSRILEELYNLASDNESNHLQALLSASNLSETSLRNKSKKILQRILHGYSWFRVETIDTFFQGIIRSFVREIGIAGNYNIELDTVKVLDEAIDRLLDKLGEDKEMLAWLLNYIDIKIGEGKSWAISSDLLDLGKTLFRESLIEKMPQIQHLINEGNFLVAYKDVLTEIIKSYEDKLTTAAKQAINSLEKNNFDVSDFFQGVRGPVGFLNKICNKIFDKPNSYVEKPLSSGNWAAGKSTRKTEVDSFGSSVLSPAITEIFNIFEKESCDYYTSKAILKNLHIMGLLSRLNDEISNIREDKSIFLISDTTPFIHQIINDNDTPFIYEKAGNHFKHILIDEFQDTSSMQWANFKPLVSNSLSYNNNCLLVGDVKQSIYRWRSSNWEILESQVKKEFHSSVLNEVNLETNWRSDSNLINFNNNFFEQASLMLDQHLSEIEADIIKPGIIYKDVAQKTPSNKENNIGYVNIKVFRKDEIDSEEYYQDELVERINEALNQGYKPGDIAVLIRNKKGGTLLANIIVNSSKQGLFSSDVGVISNESLFLHSSVAVRLLVSAMQFIDKPDSELFAANLLANYLQLKTNNEGDSIKFPAGTFTVEKLEEYLGFEFLQAAIALKQESLYGIVERLSLIFSLYNTDKDLVYIHSFLDLVFNYATSEQSDLNRFLHYWNEEGHLKTISAAESSDSIRILTIHKSKGLQFPVVILPFASWSIVPKANEKIWLEPKQSPYDTLPYLPVNFSKDLDSSIFKPDFIIENYLTLIDNLNLLYVAFTRAENILFSFLTEGSKELKSINKLIIESLDGISHKLPINFIEKEYRYTLGNATIKTKTDNIQTSGTMPNQAPSETIPTVRISSRASDFMSQKPVKDNPATFGRILHSIMEKCITADDILLAVQSKVEEGILSQTEGSETIELLTNAINLPKANNWFKNKYIVLTEADIIAPGGKIKRPDRVMLGNNEAIVVDYKFGLEGDKKKHIKQVQEYMNLIKETGINNISGHIWYVMENDIIEV